LISRKSSTPLVRQITKLFNLRVILLYVGQ
jgi:hypothetical protein